MDAVISIVWTGEEMDAVLAEISEGAAPELAPDVATVIRTAERPRPLSGDRVDAWVVELDFGQGERLKEWCDARRERATEQAPNAIWTRIVARVNEAVQPFAPAKEPADSTPRHASRP